MIPVGSKIACGDVKRDLRDEVVVLEPSGTQATWRSTSATRKTAASERRPSWSGALHAPGAQLACGDWKVTAPPRWSC